MKPLILFLCPHGAAKSVLAATYFQKPATQHGLELEIDNTGNEPDPEVPSAIINLLASEGLEAANLSPRFVTQNDFERAHRVISLSCNVNDFISESTQIEYWNDVPPPSQALHEARDLIYTHVEKLVNELSHIAAQ